MKVRAASGASERGSSRKNRVSAAVVLAAAAAASLAQSAAAQTTGTWKSPTGGSWGNAANWVNGVIPSHDGDTADFSTLNLTSDATVTLDGNRTAGVLVFGDTTPSNNWFVNSGSSGTLMLVNTSNAPTITVNSGTTATINAPILVNTGAGTTMMPQDLMVGGGGNLVINGTLAGDGGGVHVTAGTVEFKNLLLTQDTGPTGPGMATLTVDSGATARIDGTLTVQASPSGNMSFLSGDGTVQLRNGNSTFANPSITYGVVPNSNADCGVYIDSKIDVGSAGNHWITGNSNHNNFSVHDGDLVFRNSIVGSAGLTFSGKPYNGDPFSFVLSGDNSGWTGPIMIVEGSVVPYNDGDTVKALGPNNAVSFNPAKGQTAILYLYGQNVTIGSLSGGGAGVSSIRNAEWTTDANGAHTEHLSDATLTVNQTADGTYSGNLVDGPSDRAPSDAVYFKLGLAKNGPATLTLTGNNTYSGGTTVNGGTLEIAGTGTANPLGRGNITINSGGTLKLSQSNIFGNGVAVPNQSITVNGGTLTNNGSFNPLGNVTLNSGTIAATTGPGNGFEAFALNGTVTTTGGGNSISSTGTGSGVHLSANTVFNVAQGPIAGGRDLVVTANLLDRTPDAPAASRAGGLTKTGDGYMGLAGNNTYTGPTIVNGGTLAVVGTINSTAPLTVNAGTLSIGAIGSVHSATIQLASGATLDLTAQPTGFMLAQGQTLIAGHTGGGTSTDINGKLIVGAGTLDVGGLSNPATLGINGGLSLSGSTLRLDVGTPGGSGGDLVSVNGNLSLSGTNSVVLNSTTGALTNGTYDLINYTGSLSGGANNLGVAGAGGASRQTFAFDTSNPNRVFLTIGGTSAANLIWAGGVNNNAWDLNSTANWKNGGSPDKFFNLDNVTFDDTGAANSPVNVVGNVNPGSITVNSSKPYAFSGTGSIGGSGGLTKSGSGPLTINTVNSFAGPVTINGGSVLVSSIKNGGTPSNLGAGTAISIGNAGLVYSGSGDTTDRAVTLSDANSLIQVSSVAATLGLTGAVGGTGNLNVAGPGTLSLSGSNTYTGSTTVTSGTLAVSSDAGLGAVPAAAGNTINLAGGNLQITGSTTINANRGIVVSSVATIDAGSNNVTIASPISGAFSNRPLTFSGTNAGTIALTGNNTYSADTAISGVTVQVPSDTSFGPAARLILQNGGTVAFTADTMTDSGRAITLGTGGGGINSGGHGITIQGTVGGAGPLKLGGGGTYTMAAANSYSGGTTLDANVGRLTLNTATSTGTGPITFQGATDFELPMIDDTVPNDISVSPTATFVHWETTNGNTPTLAGRITGGNSGLKIEFNLSDSNGPGGITLSNPNNTFTANVLDINRGRLAVAATGALGNPNNLVFIDVTKSGDDNAETGFHFLAPNIHVPNPFQFNDYSNINVNGNNGEEISGNISGPGGNRGQDYYVLGGTQNNGTSSGSLKLSGNNTFTQNVTVDPDTLLIAGSPTAFGTGNTITVSPGGSVGFDGSGVGTVTNQKINVGGTGVMASNAGRGAIVNINGSNTYAGAVIMNADTTFSVEKAADTLTLANDLTTAGNVVDKIGPGTLAFNGPSPSGVKLEVLNVHAGAAQIGGAAGAAGPFTGGQVNVSNGAKLKLPAAGPVFTNKITTLNLNSSGTLDVGRSAVSLNDSNISPATLRQLIVSGYHGGAWDGPGIDTSAGDANHGLGYTEASDGVVAGLPAGTSLTKFDLYGDANLDGKVNFSDLLLLAQHYGKTGEGWVQGDFNYDGTVGFPDLLKLAQNYGQTLTAAQLSQLAPAFRADVQAAFAQVPEPGMMGVGAIGALALSRRRRQLI